MTSIQFPKMLGASSTNLTKTNVQALSQNIEALIGSEKGEFVGDPEFGVAIKKYMFEQNNYVLRDIIVDEIYTQISLFIPQVTINRKDITIIQNGKGKKARLEAIIKVTNRDDFSISTYNLVLFNAEEQK